MDARAGEAIAVELAQRIEAVQVAEVEQPDAAVVEYVAGAQVPLEQAGRGERDDAVEQVCQARFIPVADDLALDPGRQQHAVTKTRIAGVDDPGERLGQLGPGLQRAQVGTPLDLVEKRGLAIGVLHRAALAGALERPATACRFDPVDVSGEPAGQRATDIGFAAVGGDQRGQRQRAVLRLADLQFRSAGDKGQLRLLARVQGCVHCGLQAGGGCVPGCGPGRAIQGVSDAPACTTTMRSSPSVRAKA